MATGGNTPDPELRRAREDLGLSIRAASEFLKERGVKVSERSIGAYERGETDVDAITRRQILDAYAGRRRAPAPSDRTRQSGRSAARTSFPPLVTNQATEYDDLALAGRYFSNVARDESGIMHAVEVRFLVRPTPSEGFIPSAASATPGSTAGRPPVPDAPR